MHYDRSLNDLDSPALSPLDMKRMQDFHRELAKDRLDQCARCKEKWFDMRLQAGVCHRCRGRDKGKTEELPFLISTANFTDPGSIPDDLPKLTQVEEMLIARVHVFVEIRQVRGQQYKYSGHVCNFLRDIGKVYTRLPLLPENLEMVIIRPANTATAPGLSRQFRQDYRVRREAVWQWLQFLKTNHPGYRDIGLDHSVLGRLPIDGNVMDQIAAHDLPAEEDSIDIDLPDEEPPEVAAIPDMIIDHNELERLQQDAGVGNLTQPEFRSTPLREFNRNQALLSLAFPTLFPRGEAEFVTPRPRSIGFSAYIEHLMKYHDGRFARHPRFRYVVFNTLMRQQVNKKSNWFIKKREALDIDAIKAAFVNPEDPHARRILNSIVRHSASIRGTRPFWNGKRINLESYVRALKSPCLFLTFSPADYHWDSLHRFMPNYEAWVEAEPNERIRIARIALLENPHIAAFHFHRRFDAFMTCVIKPRFNVSDHWNRYEWQGRGSPHNHGFVWNKVAPELDTEDARSRQAWADYWGVHVTAINPGAVPISERTPMSLPPEQQENTLHHLSALLNRVQCHNCTTTYCLTIKKGATPDCEPTCRFYAPWEPRETPTVSKDLNPKHFMFSPVRNDDRLNTYNRLLTMSWMANTDVTPCTGSQAVLNYIGKYCTKEEKKTTAYVDLVKSILPHLNTTSPMLSLVSKMMNKLVGERDWSAQEVCHLLLNLPLQKGSRQVISLDCRVKAQQSVNLDINEDGEVQEKGKSFLQKYQDRPTGLAYLTFFSFLRDYNFEKYQSRPIAPQRLINYFPRYSPSKDLEDYSRVKMMMHHPFRRIETLLLKDLDPDGNPDIDDTYDSFTSALISCQNEHIHPELDGVDDGLSPLPDAIDIDEFEGQQEAQDNNDLEWAALAGQRPGRDNTNLEDGNALGHRDIDRLFDWSPCVNTHPDVTPDWWNEQKTAFPKSLEVEYASQTVVDSLNLKQRQIYDLVIDHFEASVAAEQNNSPPPPQLLLQDDGKAGTGKSFVIKTMSAHLQQMAASAGHRNPVQRAAPTGVAAHGISGRTLHALFRLPIRASAFQPLKPADIQSVQATLRSCKYLICDEKSMISLRQMHWLDQRCRQIFPRGADMPFGGLNVILLGDFFQLPPVGSLALYNTGMLKSELDIAGRVAYHQFNRTIELDEIVRQQGAGEAPFRQALEGLRHNTVTRNDWDLLTTRVAAQLTDTEVHAFDDAIRIFGRKIDVNEYNQDKMAALNVPVIQLEALHEGHQASDASFDDASNLHKTLPICIGARIMLTENLWTERGLVNGALGTVIDLTWSEGATVKKDLPLAVLVAFDKYEDDGPCLYRTDAGCPVVPIFTSRREFFRGAAQCHRTQFPLTVAFAVTVHKAQGMTVDQAVLNIARKDFVVGLTYVAVSRVKSLSGILFESPFDFIRFKGIPTHTETMRLADKARRLSEVVAL